MDSDTGNVKSLLGDRSMEHRIFERAAGIIE